MPEREKLCRKQLRIVAADPVPASAFRCHFLPDFLNVAFREQVSTGNRDHPIGNSIYFIQNMARDQDVHALAAQLFKQRNRLGARHWIEAVQRLIEHQNARMMRYGPGQANLLPHAFAVAGDLAIRCVAKLHASKRLKRETISPHCG